jgi:D-psicose/D-tagatose/L-ribulose 3-epimerase
VNKILFSVNTAIFPDADIAEILKHIKEVHADGVDISGEPDIINAKRIKNKLDEYGLKVFCINGNFTDEKRAICHNNPAYRKKAINYCKKCIDMALELECDKVLVVPSQVLNPKYFISYDSDLNYAIESLVKIGEYAKEGNIFVLLECINYYEVSLVHSLDEGIRLAKKTGIDNIRLVADVFHMQLGEKDGITSALRQAGSEWIKHIHISDNTRMVPGRGCMNWKKIFMALKEINYGNAVSFEPLGGVMPFNDLINELEFSLRYLKSILKTL